MTEAFSSIKTESRLTLPDLVLIMSGGWALPFAVEATFGRPSRWRYVAYLFGGVLGLLWGWYCKRAEWFVYRWLFRDLSVGPLGRAPSVPRALGIYVGVLMSSMALQYAVYRVLRAAFVAAFRAR